MIKVSSLDFQNSKFQNFKFQVKISKFQSLKILNVNFKTSKFQKIKCFSKIESFVNQTFLDKDSNQEGINENHTSQKTVGSKSSHNLKV